MACADGVCDVGGEAAQRDRAAVTIVFDVGDGDQDAVDGVRPAVLGVGHDERFAGAQRVGDRLVVADVAVRGLCGGDLLDGQGLDPVEAEHRGDLSQAWTVVHGGSQ